MSDQEKPTPPEDWECCHSGCEPCVWDRYDEALDAWSKKQAPEEASGQE